MIIAFDSKEIRRICEDADEANVQLGHAVANELRKRLGDINAATSVTDLIVGNPSELIDGSNFNYKVDLCEGYRLVFCANHVNPPYQNGKINWVIVKRIKILKIEKFQ